MKDMLAVLQAQLKARGMLILDLLRDKGLIEEQHQAREWGGGPPLMI